MMKPWKENKSNLSEIILLYISVTDQGLVET